MVTTAAKRVLIDTNVLVYASLRQSPFHAEAIQAIHTELQAGTELWVSRQVLREYIAVLTRPGATVAVQSLRRIEQAKDVELAPSWSVV